MKTAGRENPNRWAHVFINRARGAAGQNPCLFKWAAKQEKLQSLEELFFLTSPFIERFLWGRHVDHRVHHGHRSIESDCSAIERGYRRIAGSREGDSSGSDDSAHHGAATCSVDGCRTTHLPKYILGLRSVNQNDAARKSWSAHCKRGCHLEDPDGVHISLGVGVRARSRDIAMKGSNISNLELELSCVNTIGEKCSVD